MLFYVLILYLVNRKERQLFAVHIFSRGLIRKQMKINFLGFPRCVVSSTGKSGMPSRDLKFELFRVVLFAFLKLFVCYFCLLVGTLAERLEKGYNPVFCEL